MRCLLDPRKEENHEPFPQCLLAELGLSPGRVAASQGLEQQASGAQTPAQKGEKPQRWTLVCGISTSAPGGAVDGAGIWRKEKAMDHMAIWCGEKDAAELGNSSKPPITPENVKGVENRSYGRRFLCTWSNIMRVTIILHAGQAGVSVWTLILMDLRDELWTRGLKEQCCPFHQSFLLRGALIP
ncbi:hypothetical protein Anapl_07859 [Anas platyrhynchos]|uniref:Uncharacterized protein n=1 Tax=Anas platyrhynchos TaxID=8839 RepID=R0JC65_ANAPL|nr:hypothetical protein Anapl_07859 [Anas platyrhynchos]